MKVFKFGGASVKDAEAVKNVGLILEKYPDEKLLVIISAMGKMTNEFERLVGSYYYDKESVPDKLSSIIDYHMQIVHKLFPDSKNNIYNELDSTFGKLKLILDSKKSDSFDEDYDRIVSFGEILSTQIISNYLNYNGCKNTWFDIREVLITDKSWREARVDWEESEIKSKSRLLPLFDTCKLVVSQGFIGASKDGNTTTLGREGSDFTAAIFAFIFDAAEVIIWKDVPGLLNADPKFFPDTEKLDRISYKEIIELAYYGATIIHPKTIKPLQNKKIPLLIKSFLNPDKSGSFVDDSTYQDSIIPSYIFKQNQVLISISPKDFSFIAEQNLSIIFGKMALYGLKSNLMQNSAISFSVCLDNSSNRIDRFIEDLNKDYNVKFNRGLELVTIRHFTEEIIEKVLRGREILVEQRSRSTAQLLVLG